MKNFYAVIFCLVILNLSGFAQFSGLYAPEKWTPTLSPGSSGSVNTTGAPASITIQGSDSDDGGGQADTDFTIVAASSGIIKFHWEYTTVDGPNWDPAGVLINGVFTALTTMENGNAQSGDYTSAYITAGTQIGFRVRATDNFGGPGILTISNFSAPGGILPVNLLSFTAKPQQSAVLLQWTAENEQAFSHFEVERSDDGAQFTRIASVSAQQIRNYQASDLQPLNGTNHYRLRMVDVDGSVTYSKIVTVKMNSSSVPKIYPNPSHGQVNISLQATATEKSNVVVVDVTGRQVYKESRLLSAGMNNIQMQLQHLPAGSYMVSIGEHRLRFTLVD